MSKTKTILGLSILTAAVTLGYYSTIATTTSANEIKEGSKRGMEKSTLTTEEREVKKAEKKAALEEKITEKKAEGIDTSTLESLITELESLKESDITDKSDLSISERIEFRVTNRSATLEKQTIKYDLKTEMLKVFGEDEDFKAKGFHKRGR